MYIKKIIHNTYSLHPKFIDLAMVKIDSNRHILIDTGYHSTATKELIPYFEENQIHISSILCTHSHLDHTGGNPPLVDRYQSTVVAPYGESIFCESTYNMYILRNNFRFTVTKEKLPQFSYQVDTIIPNNCTQLDLLGLPFKVLPLPGHSPYHTGYITPDNIAYLADAIISEDLLKKTKIPYVFDIGKDLQSKRSLKTLNCDGYLLSHSGYYENIDYLVDLNIQHLLSKTEQLLDFLDIPRTFEDYTSHVMAQLNIRPSIKKIVYLQEMLYSFMTYFLQNDLVDVSESKGLIYLCKK